MKKYGIGMLFSFDGCKECQDYNRPLAAGNKSSFDLIAPKIPLILKYFPNMTMRMTIHKPTVHTYYENHKFAVDCGFKNTFAAINTFDDWTDEDFKVLEDQMYKVADLYIELIKSGKVVNFNPLIRQYTKIKAIRAGRNRTSNSKHLGYGRCGIGANGSVVLATNGDLYTCQETYTNKDIRDFFHVGNIWNGVSDERRRQIFTSYDPAKLRRADGKSCEGCKINQVCDGGCLVRNYTHNLDLNIVPVCVCKHENLMYDVFLYIEKNLKDNELFNKTVLNGKGGR